ncbi:MAG: hypothetical protein AB7E05_08985 [Sphingobium sp.]
MGAFYRAAIAALAIVLPIGSLQAQTALPPELPREVEGPISTFFETVKQGQGDKALQGLFGSSPLWARAGIKEQMSGQLDTAVKIYGPIQDYECPTVYRTGTMLIRTYCLSQHPELVMRWQFDFVRTAKGWSLSYFSFIDQSNLWPDKP